MSFQPAVYLNRHRETAIVFKVEQRIVHFITLRAGTIDIEKLPAGHFVEEFNLSTAYPVRRAAKHYLNSLLAKTNAARRALRTLVNT